MSTEEHRRRAGQPVVRCGVITVSDTRGADNDPGGDLIASLLAEAGHAVAGRRWVRDDVQQIRGALNALIFHEQCEAVILTGGTGIARRDTTYEAVEPLLAKRMDGFGELFRNFSYSEVGPAAMLSRALAGVYHDRLVFALPGSLNGVRLAMTKLIVPELSHLLWEVQR